MRPINASHAHAAGGVATFGLSLLLLGLAPSASAVERIVTSCGEYGPGTLRAHVAASASGDVVRIPTCSDMELLGGQIDIPQDNLTIIGAGYLPRLSATLWSRVFHHTGTGTLRLEALQLRSGRIRANVATGGCVHSEGHVQLISAGVGYCEAIAEGGVDPIAVGGGIYAKTLEMHDSRVFSSLAMGPDSRGGGIATLGRVRLLRSWVYYNDAGNAGGIYTLGGATITYSTIELNTAEVDNAGIQASGGSVTINKSHISSNVAGRRCGGVCVAGTGRTSVLDSTIALNRATFLAGGELSDDADVSNSTIYANVDTSGSVCAGAIRARHLRLQSSIVAQNLCQAAPGRYVDIGGRPWEGWTLTGANNIIRGSLMPVPRGTLAVNPMLEAAHSNGGPTQTYRLLRGSPAIDRGNNSRGRLYDQRGPGYPRVFGPRADIGAYEVQVSY